ncbi:uncharacterized protein K02A2.6-like [Galendromus occidentalis]|uniref:RNA-directed DNA polymerase n=1 Tax=Galendromus occidentalis TaxID=34638 RepID=A0AAJ6VX45_9ACAR|nr:uncharacterized protein K02A2.6-like [Galendromus occidentalis]
MGTRKDNCENLRPLLKWLQGSGPMPEQLWRTDPSESAIAHGAIFGGHRVLVPLTCRPQVLEELREGHFGSDKMKELALRYIWWDTINKDIEELAKQCATCAQFAKQPSKSYHPWENTEQPFDRIHCDYAGPIEGRYLFSFVDAQTKWLEVMVSKSKTSLTSLNHLREIIARLGLPRVIVTDNDPTAASSEFNKFCQANGILHKASPPYHPASNGQVERHAQTTKQALKEIRAEGD